MKDNKVKQKFLKLKEETDQFIKILQILFDTYEMFHIQGRFNYISMLFKFKELFKIYLKSFITRQKRS